MIKCRTQFDTTSLWKGHITVTSLLHHQNEKLKIGRIKKTIKILMTQPLECLSWGHYFYFGLTIKLVFPLFLHRLQLFNKNSKLGPLN